MALDPDFVAIIICPESGMKLQVASDEIIQSVNEKIAAGAIHSRSGEARTQPLAAGLITVDGRRLFEVAGDIPNLVIDDAIELEGA